MAAYATPADLINRYDVDMIGDLSTDERVAQSRSDIPTNSKVLTALEDASGEVEVALLAGGRYTADQLAGLSGHAASHLKQIVCGLAIAALHRRRPQAFERSYIEDLTRDAREAIRSLRRGDNVFGLDEHIAASVVDTGGPTAIDLQTRNDLTVRMGRYFPTSETRLPRDR